MKNNNRSSPKRDPFIGWMLIGILVLFIASYPLHFSYEWTGKNIIAGLFTPVNESPWEHLKLAFWPILFWWIIGYLVFGIRKSNAFPRHAVSCAAAEIVSLLFVVAFFYTYTGAFGIESLTLDIISLFLALLAGVLTAIHLYRHTKPGAFAAFIAVVLLIVMAGAFLFFTFMPPHIPLFRDPPTGSYGI